MGRRRRPFDRERFLKVRDGRLDATEFEVQQRGAVPQTGVIRVALDFHLVAVDVFGHDFASKLVSSATRSASLRVSAWIQRSPISSAER